MVETLRQEALQTTFSLFLGVLCPLNIGGLGGSWSFSTAAVMTATFRRPAEANITNKP
jgi:hypothetical protein